MRTHTHALSVASGILFLAAALAACSGGGGGSTTPPTNPATAAPATATPIASATATPSPAATATASAGATSTAKPSASPTATATATATATPTATPTPTPTPSPVPTATPVPSSVTGTLSELVSGAPLVNFTVALGTIPNAPTCNFSQTSTHNACGFAPTTIASTVTNASGAFAVPTVTPGNYMLTISSSSAYAALHRTITIGATSQNLGALKIAALTSDEQAWIADINGDRTFVSNPQSFGNLVIDEYAEEQARIEANAIAAGTYPNADATEATFSSAYTAQPGAMYQSGGVLSAIAAPSAFLQADNIWFGEAANCPQTNWMTCTFAGNTGHYIALSYTQNVWIGLGESSSKDSTARYIYAGVTVVNVQTAVPAGLIRSRH